MHEYQVTYHLSDEQKKELEVLVPHWRETTKNVDYSSRDVFNAIMTIGCDSDINKRLRAEYFRQLDAAD